MKPSRSCDRKGIGAIAIFDGEVVELSNLSRQHYTVAGVTSGLAAVGGTLAGGVAVAAAGPAVVAGLIGYAVYKFFRK